MAATRHSGFDFRAISPISFITRELDVVDPETGNIIKRPFDDIVYVGGDTQAIANLEYRIPIVGPITVAPFLDVGNAWVTRRQQLTRTIVDSAGVVHTGSSVPAGIPVFASTGVKSTLCCLYECPVHLILRTIRCVTSSLRRSATGSPFFITEPKRDMKFTVGRTF
jgi:hypothetical protein